MLLFHKHIFLAMESICPIFAKLTCFIKLKIKLSVMTYMIILYSFFFRTWRVPVWGISCTCRSQKWQSHCYSCQGRWNRWKSYSGIFNYVCNNIRYMYNYVCNIRFNCVCNITLKDKFYAPCTMHRFSGITLYSICPLICFSRVTHFGSHILLSKLPSRHMYSSNTEKAFWK